MNAKVFVIEGPDGVGKSTLIDLLSTYFNNNTSYTCKVVSPSGNEYGRMIKGILNERDVDLRTE